MEEGYDREIVAAVRRFLERDGIPVARDLAHRDEYPHTLVARVNELGLL